MSPALDPPIISQNRMITDPKLSDLLNLLKKDIMISLNCHALATIESFDPIAQTVTATINYKKTYFEPNPVTGSYDPVLVDYPILVDCPIISLCGGLSALTFPVEAGDTCLILFNDRSIDTWFSSGQVGALSSQRLHSFSDGIALIGLRSLGNLIQDYDPSRAVLRNDQAMVGVGPELVKIANNVSTLKGVLNGLIDIIKALQTIPAVTGSPLTLSPADIAQLEAYKATVGGLLE